MGSITERFGFVSSIFRDKRGNASFTRIAPAVCLVAAFVAWVYGLYHPDLGAYCQQGVDKAVDFAKWAFGAGKAAEELVEWKAKPDAPAAEG